jgi:hypothetical protein
VLLNLRNYFNAISKPVELQRFFPFYWYASVVKIPRFQISLGCDFIKFYVKHSQTAKACGLLATRYKT